MAIRFMRAEGSMPQTSSAGHAGKGPAGGGGFPGPSPMVHVPGPVVGSKPQGGGSPSPGGVPSTHPLIPWLLMAMAHAAKAAPSGAAPAPSSGKTLVPDHPADRTLKPSHGVYQKIGGLPRANAANVATAPAGVAHQSPEESFLGSLPKTPSQALPTRQEPSTISEGQEIVAPEADTVARGADTVGRDASVPVPRAADNQARYQAKRGGLVHPQQRVYQKAAVQKYALKRPLG